MYEVTVGKNEAGWHAKWEDGISLYMVVAKPTKERAIFALGVIMGVNAPVRPQEIAERTEIKVVD